jgi:enoyl-CoA hydratase/carnithine racemase
MTVAGSVATVVVGDGRRRNALDTAGWDALRHSVAGLPNELQAVVVHGAGATFCAARPTHRRWSPQRRAPCCEEALRLAFN